MHRAFSTGSALNKTAITALALATLIGMGAARADDKKASEVSWAVTLGKGEKSSLDGKPWEVTLFDAVTCKWIKQLPVKVGKDKPVSFRVATKRGAGDAKPNELGAHFRWTATGIGPGHVKKCWWGDPKPAKDGASFQIFVSDTTGDATCSDIADGCKHR
jgi:hypothetical protein